MARLRTHNTRRRRRVETEAQANSFLGKFFFEPWGASRRLNWKVDLSGVVEAFEQMAESWEKAAASVREHTFGTGKLVVNGKEYDVTNISVEVQGGQP